MFTQEIVAQEAEVKIQLPPEMIGKELRITVEEKPAEEVDRAKLLAEAKAFFDSISVDMSGFTFDREEANAR